MIEWCWVFNVRNVAVVGVGQTKFGELWEKSLRNLVVEAGNACLSDCGMERKDVQSMYVGNMSAGRFAGQEHVGALAADQLGFNPIPSVRCEAACASGAMAFNQAYMAVASGKYDVVMAAGVEKMSDIRQQDVATSLAAASDQEWEAEIGLTFAGLYALMARLHMHKYGTTREQLAMVSVINHENSVGNPYAQFPFKITIEDVLNSVMVADPLRVLDCSPITDGAAAVLLVSESVAKKCKNPVWVLASETASDTLALHDRRSLCELDAAKHAAKKAYAKTGLKPGDIGVAEVHDCFSINEVLCIEALGFCEVGKGGEFIENGEIRRGGSIPVNTTGGLKAIGHPVGATGIRQIIDITHQLRGSCFNKIKVDNGLALNVGGSGATASINVLGVEPESK